VRGRDLVSGLVDQAEKFGPGWLLGHSADGLEHLDDGRLRVTTRQGAAVTGAPPAAVHRACRVGDPAAGVLGAGADPARGARAGRRDRRARRGGAGHRQRRAGREPVCPVTAISSDLRIAADLVPWRDDNAAFFDLPLPGRDGPLGSPRGAGELGKLDADGPLAAVTPATAASD
jgi:hypothetical protein